MILFIRLKDEKHGLLSYLKNYILKIVITVFIGIFLFFVVLSIYFWLSVLSLLTHLRKGNQKKARELSAGNNVNLSEDLKAQSSQPVQLIPLRMMQSAESGENVLTENAKFFILHV